MSLATRTAAHREREQAKKARKRLRIERAAIHAAMTEAARMKRSRKKGTTDFEANMRTLGFVGKHSGAGREVPGDVLDKYQAVA